MKKSYTIAALGLIAIAFFLKTGTANALLLFLLVGAVPGTGYNIPASGMLFLFFIPVWLVFVRIITLESVQDWVKNLTSRDPIDHKKRLPRKRFGQI